jgi:hypothetical protein
MTNVTVRPIQTISVRVNQSHQQTVTGTSTYIGSALAQKINAAYATANNAVAATTGEVAGKFVGGDF